MTAVEQQVSDHPDPRFMLSRLADFRNAHVDYDGFDVEFDAYGMIVSTRNWVTDETIELSHVDGVAQLLEEAGLHRDQPLAVSRKTAAGQWPPHSPVTSPR